MGRDGGARLERPRRPRCRRGPRRPGAAVAAGGAARAVRRRPRCGANSRRSGCLHSHAMKVGIIGIGYVGLPLAVAFAEAGHEVWGVEVDPARVAALERGESYVEDISSERLQAVLDHVHPTTRCADLAQVESVVIAVPTPLTRNREPDLGPLEGSARRLGEVLQQGQLVVLESTTYPGTTRERLVPLLEEPSGL